MFYKFRRYQVKKIILANIKKGHPWVFSKNLSSAINVFRHGDWVKLVDDNNNIVGHGIYDQHHPSIKIRLFHIGPEEVSLDFIKKKIIKTINKRIVFSAETNGLRLINGDGDFFPGITVDQFGSTLVLQVTSRVFYVLGRFVSSYLKKIQPNSNCLIKSIYLNSTNKREENSLPSRWLTKQKNDEKIEVTEPTCFYQVNINQTKQLEGILDLRGVRRMISGLDLRGKKVLDLGCGSASLSIASALAGAVQVDGVDKSEVAIQQNQEYCQLKQLTQCHFTVGDVFKEGLELIKKTSGDDPYDLIIFNEATSSRFSVMEFVKKDITWLHKNILPYLKTGGAFISISRQPRLILKDYFYSIKKAVVSVFADEKWTSTLLEVEKDHRIKDIFIQGQYLKASFWESKKNPFPRVEENSP